MEIKNSETVAIKTQFHNGKVWNQTLINRKTGERLTIGLFPGREDEDSEWRFGELRSLITKRIQSVLAVPSDSNGNSMASKRLGICKVDYHDCRLQCEFVFEPESTVPADGWYVSDAWVLSADALS